ncbi:patatin-like phospholipase family protein [Clostridium sp. DSM 8431]|uniref:patatin-like phospholipase family protein n=1 Tax=Clostridium sp. DSM 8431 TaxID=1761781 RepID=UPI000B7ECC17|nr:patatin-like phospholipase family protein [Clostridium sp. DSM 8431]
MSNRLEDIKIGLVLAGGGAKGAYEVGVYNALKKLELVDNIKVISGTSIGAINALFFAMDNPKIIKQSWSNLKYSQFILSQESTKPINFDSVLDKIKNINTESGILDNIKLSDIGLISQSGIKNFIEEYIDINVIKNCDKDLYSCAYNIDKERPEYFKLNDCTEEEIKDRVIASSAVPHMFKPIIIDGLRYADGGIHSPLYSKNNVDNVPIYPMKNYDLDIIIIVYLSSNKKAVNKERFSESKIIEIYPSSKLEAINGIGTLNIRQDTLNNNMDMGYRDAIVEISPVLIDILKGKNLF